MGCWGAAGGPKAIPPSALTLCPYSDAWIFEFLAYSSSATFCQSVIWAWWLIVGGKLRIY